MEFVGKVFGVGNGAGTETGFGFCIRVAGQPNHFKRAGVRQAADLCAFGTMRPVALPPHAHQTQDAQNMSKDTHPIHAAKWPCAITG
jgi:hypothetical protein